MKVAVRLCVAIVGVVLCNVQITLGQAARAAKATPIMLATVVRSHALLPVITVAGDEIAGGWPHDVEDLNLGVPMRLTAIPGDWILPFTSLPTKWKMFFDDGTSAMVQALDVITTEGDNQFEPAIRTSAALKADDRRSAVAVAGDPGATVNFVQNIEPESVEGKRLTAIAQALVVDDVIKEIGQAVSELQAEFRAGAFQPSRETVRTLKAGQVTIRRPNRPLVDGLRPVLVDYVTKYSKTAEPDMCDTGAHVRSWFSEGANGVVRSLSSEIVVRVGCDWLFVDSFPDAVVQVAGKELWLGVDNYEDGYLNVAYFFRNGRLELAYNGRGWSPAFVTLPRAHGELLAFHTDRDVVPALAVHPGRGIAK